MCLVAVGRTWSGSRAVMSGVVDTTFEDLKGCVSTVVTHIHRDKASEAVRARKCRKRRSYTC